MMTERAICAANAFWDAVAEARLPSDIRPDDRRIALLHLASYIVSRAAEDDPELTSSMINEGLEEREVGWRLVPLQ